MLLGEHSVVYGRPCLVTAMEQRMQVTVESIGEPMLRLEASDVGMAAYEKPIALLGQGEVPKAAAFVEHAVKNFVHRHPIQGGVRITTVSSFSGRFGFGSSSAVTVCVMKGLSEALGLGIVRREMFDLSYKTVLDVQKKGSGFDVAAAAYGGTLWFTAGGRELDELAVPDLPLVVGYSGSKGDTVTLMEQVKQMADAHPELVENIYYRIGQVTERARDALLARDWATLGDLMNLNQGLLEALGVSTEKLNAMIHAAREAGAFGAKLSGAGGGDCMIALAPSERRSDVEKAIAAVGGEVLDVKVGAEGVRVE